MRSFSHYRHLGFSKMPFALLAIVLLNFQAPPAPLLLDKNYKLKGSIFLLTSNQPADYSGPTTHHLSRKLILKLENTVLLNCIESTLSLTKEGRIIGKKKLFLKCGERSPSLHITNTTFLC